MAVLKELGFGDQPGPGPVAGHPADARRLDGGRGHDVPHPLPRPAGHGGAERDLAFRDALRADPALTAHYADLKRGIVDGGLIEGHQYTYQKQRWIGDVHRQLGVERRSRHRPPSACSVAGSSRMLALAARAMGYRIAVLDPDPACPAASLADSVIVAGYDDVGAALRLATRCAVDLRAGARRRRGRRRHRPDRPGPPGPSRC